MPLATPEEAAANDARTYLFGGAFGVPKSTEVLTDPDFMSRLGATMRRENVLFSAAAYLDRTLRGGYEEDPDYNFREDPLVKAYFPDGRHWKKIAQSRSAAETKDLIRRIVAEERDLYAMQQAGLGESLLTNVFAGLTSPEALIPFGAFVKVGKTAGIVRTAGATALAGGLSTTVAEAALMATQENRTYAEAVANVAGATVLSGVLGGGAQAALRSMRSVPTKVMENMDAITEYNLKADKTIEQRAAELAAEDKDVSAALAQARQDGNASLVRNIEDAMTDQALREAGLSTNKSLRSRKLQRAMRFMPSTGRASTRYFGVVAMTEAFADGGQFRLTEGTGPSIEAALLGWRSRLEATRSVVHDIAQKNTVNKNDRLDFLSQTISAARNMSAFREASVADLGMDQVRKDAVLEAAAVFRETANEVSREASVSGFLTDMDGVMGGDTAEFWVARVYNKDRLINDSNYRTEFREKLATYYANHIDELDTNETPDQIADAVIQAIMGDNLSPVAFRQNRATAFDARVLKLPDAEIEDVLINDFDLVLDNIERRILPSIEVARKFRKPNPLLDTVHRIVNKYLIRDQSRHTTAHVLTEKRYVHAVGNAAEFRRRAAKLSSNRDAIEAREKRRLERQEETGKPQPKEITRAEYEDKIRLYENTAVSLRKVRHQLAEEYQEAADVARRIDEGEEVAEELLEPGAGTVQREQVLQQQLRGLEDELMGVEKRRNKERGIVSDDEFLLREDNRVLYDPTNPLEDPLEYRLFDNEAQLSEQFELLRRDIRGIRRIEAVDAGEARSIMNTVVREKDDVLELLSGEERRQAQREWSRAKKNLDHMLAFTLNRVGQDQADTWFAFVERSVRNINYLRFMGGVTISSLPDVAMGIFVHGWNPYWKAVGAMLNDPATFKGWVKEDFARFAAGYELAMGGARLAEVGGTRDIAEGARRGFRSFDETDPRPYIDQGLSRLADGMSKLSGIKRWQWAMKGASSILASDNLLRISKHITENGRKGLTDVQLNAVKISGLTDDQFKAIWKYGKKHSQTVNQYLMVARSSRWGTNPDGTRNAEGAEVQRLFEGTIIQDMNRTTITPGVGDKPVFLTQPYLRVFGQFRSFAFAATNRMLLSGIERNDAAVFQGMASLLFMGIVTNDIKERIRGRTVDYTGAGAVNALTSAIDRSGMLGIASDLGMAGLAAFSMGTGVGTRGWMFDRFADRSLTDIIFGPTFGTMSDFNTAQDILSTRNSPDKPNGMTEADVRRIRRLMPFQNLWYLRILLDGFNAEPIGDWRGFNVEAKLAEAL